MSMHVLFQTISKFLEFGHADRMVSDYGDIPEQIDLHVSDCVSNTIDVKLINKSSRDRERPEAELSVVFSHLCSV